MLRWIFILLFFPISLPAQEKRFHFTENKMGSPFLRTVCASSRTSRKLSNIKIFSSRRSMGRVSSTRHRSTTRPPRQSCAADLPRPSPPRSPRRGSDSRQSAESGRGIRRRRRRSSTTSICSTRAISPTGGPRPPTSSGPSRNRTWWRRRSRPAS